MALAAWVWNYDRHQTGLTDQMPRNTPSSPSPSALRSVFGANLRQLVDRDSTITSLAQTLGINRTQFNRYLAGESFPRPDILDRICRYFDVDARILTTPLASLAMAPASNLSDPFIADWIGPAATAVPEAFFPSGFYRFSRQSFMDDTLFLQGLVQVSRQHGTTFLRGLEPREAIQQQGLPNMIATRDFRGIVLRQEDGVSIVIGRRRARTGSLNFLAPVASYENHIWEGYVTRTVRAQPTGRRASRMVYEYLGTGLRAGLAARRRAGFCLSEDLPAHHLRLLRINQPFD